MTATAKALSTRSDTYAGYLTWPDEGRWELIDGEVWEMSPAPAIVHQEVLLRLGATVEGHILGAPDLVVEILFPATARKDEGIKRDRYQRAGVPEYWLIHPRDRVVTRYTLEEGRYGLPEIFGPEDGESRSQPLPADAAAHLAERLEDLLLPPLFDADPVSATSRVRRLWPGARSGSTLIRSAIEPSRVKREALDSRINTTCFRWRASRRSTGGSAPANSASKRLPWRAASSSPCSRQRAMARPSGRYTRRQWKYDIQGV